MKAFSRLCMGLGVLLMGAAMLIFAIKYKAPEESALEKYQASIHKWQAEEMMKLIQQSEEDAGKR